MRRRSITITRSLADASAAKYRHARVHRARYYERRWSLCENVTSRYDKSSTCHAQIQFYEARSRRMEVHRQRRGTPRNTPPPGLRHDGGWIPPGVQAFGDLARQPWPSSDSEKGMYAGELGWLRISSREWRAHRGSDGNETERRVPSFDLPTRAMLGRVL